MRKVTDERCMRRQIIEATIRVFNRKGLKFTMDDIAQTLSISKKTIYILFTDKQTMFMETVNYCFDRIKESEQEVLQDNNLSTLEKIKRILGVLPEGYQEINFAGLYELKDKYPQLYEQVQMRLETGWENTILLLRQGMQEGVLREFQIPVFKTMFEATLEKFFMQDVLVSNQISYAEALEEVVNILVDGIVK